MVSGHVHAAHGVFRWWPGPPISGRAPQHDMAQYPCVLCHVQHPTLAAVYRRMSLGRHQSRTLFLVRVHRLVRMV